jgi:hypothetical protein
VRWRAQLPILYSARDYHGLELHGVYGCSWSIALRPRTHIRLLDDLVLKDVRF